MPLSAEGFSQRFLIRPSEGASAAPRDAVSELQSIGAIRASRVCYVDDAQLTPMFMARRCRHLLPENHAVVARRAGARKSGGTQPSSANETHYGEMPTLRERYAAINYAYGFSAGAALSGAILRDAAMTRAEQKLRTRSAYAPEDTNFVITPASLRVVRLLLIRRCPRLQKYYYIQPLRHASHAPRR